MSARAMSQPKTEPCNEKEGLLEDILVITLAIKRLCDLEAEVINANERAILRTLRTELETAKQWKKGLIDELTRHIRVHGC